MNKLLFANFMRIKKNKLFWILCSVTALLSLWMVLNAITNKDAQIDNLMCFFVIPAEIAAAVFISIFFGTEYGDGTMRNKLIVGHDRRNIYFADLIASYVCALALCVSYMLPIILLGFPLVALPTVRTLEVVSVGIVALLAFCSLFTMVSMIYANKAGSTVINILLAFLLLAVSAIICVLLIAPEFYSSYGIDGTVEYLRNPQYISGIKRSILQFIIDFLPAGQAVQFMTGVSSPLWTFALYSVIVCAVCSIVGAFVFHKKDIK